MSSVCSFGRIDKISQKIGMVARLYNSLRTMFLRKKYIPKEIKLQVHRIMEERLTKEVFKATVQGRIKYVVLVSGRGIKWDKRLRDEESSG